MKFTLNWLKNFLDTDKTLQEITDALTAAGLEVEEIIDRSHELASFIVAEILEATQHPQAEKLKICRVFDGEKELQIVCGAPNARAGIKVVLAPIGAVIPANGMVIKLSNIREAESCGMLCSASELKLSGQSDGIIELDPDSRVGEKFITVAGLTDPLIELKITPNRGDCLGVYGIARDLAARGHGKLKDPEFKTFDEGGECKIKIAVEPGSGCKRYHGRYFTDVNNNMGTPEFIKKYLTAIGAKSISLLVDITNFSCFAYGRPLHIYDADKIVGNVVVRQANAGEKFLALNDILYEMKGGECVICDDEGIISLAAILGGKRTACNETTKNILLETIVCNSISTAATGRQHMIDTDSRYRFDRKIDEGFIKKGDNIASNLILEIAGGIASKPIDLVIEEFKSIEIKYSADEFTRIAGFTLAEKTIIEILQKLGFELTNQSSSGFTVRAPSFRNDIEIADDLTEDILISYGYNNIPSHSILSDNLPTHSIPPQINAVSAIARSLAMLGYNELVTWSFMQKAKVIDFAEFEPALELINPISAELSYMRPTIIANLLAALKLNRERGFEDLSFFEIGSIFGTKYDGLQTKVCTGVRSGFAQKKSIHDLDKKFDVFDIKRDLFQSIEECGFDPYKMTVAQDRAAPKYYHPAQSAAIYMGKHLIAYFGKLHPQILAMHELDSDSFAFELFIDNLPQIKTKSAKRTATDFSDFQAIKRDFAFILDKQFPAGNLIKIIEVLDKKLIQKVEIFDLFSGSSIGEDKKSVALRVTIQAQDRTLTEAEIEPLSKRIIEEITVKANGVLRA